MRFCSACRVYRRHILAIRTRVRAFRGFLDWKAHFRSSTSRTRFLKFHCQLTSILPHQGFTNWYPTFLRSRRGKGFHLRTMTTTSRIQFLIYRLNLCLGKGTQLDGTSSGFDGRPFGGWSSGVWRWMRGISRAIFLLATLLSFLKFQADGEKYRERTQRGDFQTSSPNKYLLLFCTSSETEERPVGDGMV